MKRLFFTIVTIILFIAAKAQTARTFTIEQLTKPTKVLLVTSYDTILKHLILSEDNLTPSEVKEKNMVIPYGIVAHSKIAYDLVDMGYHPFFNGLYRAYADHRPFVISPDMIWLLICQGFSMHVNQNAEKLRKKFVNFKGKEALIVSGNKSMPTDPSSWQNIFAQFSRQIDDHIGKGLVKNLTPDFTTTNTTDKIASQITIMNTMKQYFNFYVLYISCGIPSITLKGTTADWQKVLHKANGLRQYDLGWWIDSLEPVLKQFVNTSEGKIDTAFWRDIFKYHSNKVPCGRSGTIDGWIVKFFPYDKNGKRTNLKTLSGSGQLPEEMVKVPLQYMVNSPDGSVSKTPLELWAGFVGLKQDTVTFAVQPEIGWMVRKQDIHDGEFKEKLTKGRYSGLSIRVKKVPESLLNIKKISSLEIFFTDSIHMPAGMQNISIGQLSLHGKVSNKEEKKIVKMFQQSLLHINDKLYKTNAWPFGR